MASDSSGAKSLEIKWRWSLKAELLGVSGPTILSKYQVTSHTMMNWAADKDFVTHALDFAFGDLCQECPGFDLGCGAVHSLIMPWKACWQGWVDGGVLLNYFLANFWEEAFLKCHNTVIFEKWTEPRWLIGQGHSQFLLDKYLVARRLYLNENYLLRKLLPGNSCRGQDPIPSGKYLRTTPKLTQYSLYTQCGASSLRFSKLCCLAQQENLSVLYTLHLFEGHASGLQCHNSRNLKHKQNPS